MHCCTTDDYNQKILCSEFLMLIALVMHFQYTHFRHSLPLSFEPKMKWIHCSFTNIPLLFHSFRFLASIELNDTQVTAPASCNKPEETHVYLYDVRCSKKHHFHITIHSIKPIGIWDWDADTWDSWATSKHSGFMVSRSLWGFILAWFVDNKFINK